MMHYITVNFPHYKAAQHFVCVFYLPFFFLEFKKLLGEEQQSHPAVVCNDADVTLASENLDTGKTRQSRSANIFHQFVG